MLIKINKKYYRKLDFNQINSSLSLNGRLVHLQSTKFKIFVNFLNCLSLSVNIIVNKNNKNRIRNNKKRKIITSKLLLKISIIIKQIIKDKNYNLINNEINNNEKDAKNDKYINIFTNKKSIIFISILFIIILVFIIDYKSIETKINQSNYYEIKEIESNYRINKCEINGELPSLKQKCELMLSRIEILKNKKPSLISVFFIWFLDIFNSYFTTFSLINCIITIIFIIIVYKLLK